MTTGRSAPVCGRKLHPLKASAVPRRTVTSATIYVIVIVATLRSSATARLRAAWFSNRNYRVVISASDIEDFLNNSRNLLPPPNVVQALSQCRAVTFRGELLQEISGNRVWSPASQLQCKVIDNLARIVERQINRKVSPKQIFGKLDLFHFVEEIEIGLLLWADWFL
jgi:hypothetical protein